MSTKIRLQRKGRKKKAFYTIVVSNSRSPRDGKFIEKIGFYNPNTNPYTISINIDKAVNWLIKGAQPTCTVKSLFLFKGIFFKKYLINGIKKKGFSNLDIKNKFKILIHKNELY